MRLQPLQSVKELNEDPQQTLLIVLGDMSSLETLPTPGLKGLCKAAGDIWPRTARPGRSVS